MNANLLSDDCISAEDIMLRTIEDMLPDLWIVSTEVGLDIRDAEPDEEFMLEWNYPGRITLDGIVPELDVTETRPPARAGNASATQSTCRAGHTFWRAHNEKRHLSIFAAQSPNCLIRCGIVSAIGEP